jgi:leucyl aminopeptidase
MSKFFVDKKTNKMIPVEPICQNNFSSWQSTQKTRVKNLVSTMGFQAKPNTFCFVTDNNGGLVKVLLGIEDSTDYLAFGALPKVLPAGLYHIQTEGFSKSELELAAIGWGMGNYQFKKYKALKDYPARLFCDKKNYNLAYLSSAIESIFLVRDLINTAASDLYPEKMAEIAIDLVKKFKAQIKVIKDKELITNFPSVYAVGRGSEKKPLLLDIHYGKSSDPKIALVGKGVCFDSGGLQIKGSSSMLLMKKDMAGAAHVLSLASMVMSAKLPVNLRVIIPLVENLLGKDPLKPNDIITSRKGMSIEVGNTDAEGRLILADALAYASEWQPEVIIDFATLTGASRVALGPDITALFSNSDELSSELTAKLHEQGEPAWRMPLYKPYSEYLKCKIADIRNVTTGDVGGGAITAALFLQKFVGNKIPWAHFDLNAYNGTTKPGRPEGGEACCLRGVFKYIERLASDRTKK